MDKKQLAVIKSALKECDSITDPDKCEFAAKHGLCLNEKSNGLSL